MKLPKHFNKEYLWEFVFFLLLYLAFGFFVLGMHEDKSPFFYMSLLFFGIVYGLVCSEIFIRIDPGYPLTHAIAIPILIIVIALNHQFLEKISSP